MFQVATGRFFHSSSITRERGRAPFYSNLSFMVDMRTPIGTIHEGIAVPAGTAYVHEYDQLHQNHESVWVWGGDEEIAEQLTAFLTVLMPGFFDTRQELVEAVTRRPASAGRTGERFPADFIPTKAGRYLGNAVQLVPAIEPILARLVRVPRRQYEKLAAAAIAFKLAILTLPRDFDLAYSLVVFGLEALAGSSKATATWDDLPQDDRDRYEAALGGLDPASQERIRTAILAEKHVGLTKGFVEFCTARLTEAFYTTEAKGRRSALRPSIAPRAIQNAYAIRSRFAHDLEKHVQHIRHADIATGDVFEWDGEPYLTFAGIARVFETVFREVVKGSTETEEESSVSWRDLIPGTITMKVGFEAAGAEKTARPHRGIRTFSAALQAVWHRNENGVPDLRPLLRNAREMWAQLSPEDRRCHYWTVWLYVRILDTKLHDDWWATWLAANEPEDTWHTVLCVGMFPGWTSSMPPKAQDEAWSAMRKRNGRSQSIDVAPGLFAAAGVSVSAAYLRAGMSADYNRVLGAVRLELAGHEGAQALVADAQAANAVPDVERLRRAILGLPESKPSASASPAGANN